MKKRVIAVLICLPCALLTLVTLGCREPVTGPTPFAPGNGVATSVTFIYEAALPTVVNPDAVGVSRPTLDVGRLSGGGNFGPDFSVKLTWVGPGNKWTGTFEGIQQKEYVIRANDIERVKVEHVPGTPERIGIAFNNTITSSNFDIVGSGADPIGGWLKIKVR
jgi:hypothetical protein